MKFSLNFIPIAQQSHQKHLPDSNPDSNPTKKRHSDPETRESFLLNFLQYQYPVKWHYQDQS